MSVRFEQQRQRPPFSLGVCSAFWLMASLFLFGCDGRERLQGEPVGKSLPLSEASVHFWFDDDTLLLTIANRIVTYDLKTEEIITDISFEPEITYEPTSEALAARVSEPESDEEISAETVPIVTTMYGRPICLSETAAVLTFASEQAGLPVGRESYRIDWRQPEAYETLDKVSWHPSYYDPLNCEEEKLFEETVSTWFDGAQSQYLLHPNRQQFAQPSFSASPKNWSMSVQLLSAETRAEEVVSLPAGPWVYRHGFLKTMSCFSCGCACYESINMRMEDGQIYFMPYGKAVEDKHRGIYKLDRESADLKWQPIKLGGDVDSAFAISPDGCQVAVSEGGVPQIIDTCSP